MWSAPPPLGKEREPAASATSKAASTAVAETCRQPLKNKDSCVLTYLPPNLHKTQRA
jgi:hypothetical protein